VGYVLLSEGVFYSYQNSGATIAEICNIAKVQKPKENFFEQEHGAKRLTLRTWSGI
jgi:hypothetical protein